MDLEQYFEPLTLKRLWRGFGRHLIVVVVLVIVLAAIFGAGTQKSDAMNGATVSSPGNVFYLDVINVDTVIARQFNLPSASGVLVNQVMTGMAGRLVGLKRGDTIVKLNQVEVQSVDHLRYLMAQKQPGDTLAFVVIRHGKRMSISTTIPKFIIPVNLYTPSARNAVAAIVILTLTFIGLFFNFAHRTVCVMLGAVLMLIVGSLCGFYDQAKAFQAIEMDPIFILIGMGIFSIVLEKTRIFDYVAKKIIVAMNGDSLKTTLALCLMTYVISLFVNNLTTIMVVIPVTLYVARGLKMDPTPLAIAEIISSNIGGASTMIGDFPNMLISASTGLSFLDFMIFMMPICIVLLLVFFWYMKQFEFSKMQTIKSASLRQAFVDQVDRDVSSMRVDWPSARSALTLLAFVVAAYVILPFFKIEAATIALAGGFVLLAMRGDQAPEILRKIRISDILFFMSLFILVGGAQHAGILNGISDMISTLSMSNGLLYLLIMMWMVAFATAFLNAGPSAAFFIPVLMHGSYAVFNDTVWWALSLGILAGSCATITGATAGIVTQTLLEENSPDARKEKSGVDLSFDVYSRRGVPVAVLFLAVSSVYIIFLAFIQGIR